MTIFDAISMLGGLAMFLYGMRIMGDGLREGSSEAFKKAIGKATGTPVAGFLVGLMVTAVIQSSTATIVITSGLVGAGVISLHQSLGIILGANVGTTVTGQIIRLLDLDAGAASWLNIFKPSTLAPIAAVIGIVAIMFVKSKNSNTVGQIAMGFGILFTGLLSMSSAVSGLSDAPWFSQLFIRFSTTPVLGFIAGAAAAFAIQSSSATIGILQALSVTGQLSLSSVYSIILGIYLGDCATTAIVCSIGAKSDAKRTGVVHILFNLSEMVIVGIGITLLHASGLLDGIWNNPITSGGIANTHTIFNLCCAVIMLPFVGQLEKLSKKLVKDEYVQLTPQEEDIKVLDKAFFKSASLALDNASNLVRKCADKAMDSLDGSLELFMNFSEDKMKEVEEAENYIDYATDHVGDYLVRMSVETSGSEALINYHLRCITEFERIGDLTLNLAENAQKLSQDKLAFSDEAKHELNVLYKLIDDISENTRIAYQNRDYSMAKTIEPMEEVVDEMVLILRDRHMQRLSNRSCNVYSGSIFLDVLTNIERISDQCSNVGVHTIALFNPEAASSQHIYLEKLHTGFVEEYNENYKAARDYYMGLLEDYRGSKQ